VAWRNDFQRLNFPRFSKKGGEKVENKKREQPTEEKKKNAETVHLAVWFAGCGIDYTPPAPTLLMKRGSSTRRRREGICQAVNLQLDRRSNNTEGSSYLSSSQSVTYRPYWIMDTKRWPILLVLPLRDNYVPLLSFKPCQFTFGEN
jgi:hypothetical protein